MIKYNQRAISQQQQPEEEILIQQALLNGGMNTYADSVDILPQQLVTAENVRIEGDRIFRRPGSVIITPTKPNSSTVLLYALVTRFSGAGIYLRFDESGKIWRRGGSWTEITGAGLTFSDQARPKICVINDRVFVASGVNDIVEIDFTANTYADAGNATKHRFIVGFYNRIVAANLYDSTSPNPVQVAWSGDINFDEWNPSVNVTAGSDPLVEGSDDFSDKITGLFSFAAVLLILRERSLWRATKSGVFSKPFRYDCAFPTFGCDSPDSAARMQNGICWYDKRSNQVYVYVVGSMPTAIGWQIRNELRNSVVDNLKVQGAYSFVLNKYFLTIPSDLTTETIIFEYDFDTNSWTKQVKQNIYGTFPLDSASTTLMIDDLTGTIDSLVGDIDDLVTTTNSPAVIFFGKTDGDITQEDPLIDDDASGEFTSKMVSKTFALAPTDVSVTRLLLKILVKREGSLSVYYKKNEGEFILYKEVTIANALLNKRKTLVFTKHITCSEFQWKIEWTEGNFEILEHRLEGVASTQTRDF